MHINNPMMLIPCGMGLQNTFDWASKALAATKFAQTHERSEEITEELHQHALMVCRRTMVSFLINAAWTLVCCGMAVM